MNISSLCLMKSGSIYLEVYFGSQSMALAVVSLFAMVSGEGGFVDAQEDEGPASGAS
jgi:hypothetical protein